MGRVIAEFPGFSLKLIFPTLVGFSRVTIIFVPSGSPERDPEVHLLAVQNVGSAGI